MRFEFVELTLDGRIWAASLCTGLPENHKNTAVVVTTIAAECRGFKYGVLVEVLA